MFTLEDFMNVRDLKQQGWSVSAIAQQLDIDRKTVRKYLLEQVHPYQRASPAPCKVDPYRPFLREQIRGRGYRHNLDGYAPALAQTGARDQRPGHPALAST